MDRELRQLSQVKFSLLEGPQMMRVGNLMTHDRRQQFLLTARKEALQLLALQISGEFKLKFN